jgi:hypothetical protein
MLTPTAFGYLGLEPPVGFPAQLDLLAGLLPGFEADPAP